jgi:GNAT superfamily N-acetyltransferase
MAKSSDTAICADHAIKSHADKALTSNPVAFRAAAPGDGALVLSFIRALAEYEHMGDKVAATSGGLERQLFELHSCEAFFAMSSGREAGFALFFRCFSTFLGKPGLYLEDLFVLPEYRGRGVGKAILAELARLAISRDCDYLEWRCLDRNKPGVAFYKALGAAAMDEWTAYRLTGGALIKLSGGCE